MGCTKVYVLLNMNCHVCTEELSAECGTHGLGSTPNTVTSPQSVAQVQDMQRPQQTSGQSCRIPSASSGECVCIWSSGRGTPSSAELCWRPSCPATFHGESDTEGKSPIQFLMCFLELKHSLKDGKPWACRRGPVSENSENGNTKIKWKRLIKPGISSSASFTNEGPTSI